MRRKRYGVTRGRWNDWIVYATATGRKVGTRTYQTRKDAEAVAYRWNTPQSERQS